MLDAWKNAFGKPQCVLGLPTTPHFVYFVPSCGHSSYSCDWYPEGELNPRLQSESLPGCRYPTGTGNLTNDNKYQLSFTVAEMGTKKPSAEGSAEGVASWSGGPNDPRIRALSYGDLPRSRGIPRNSGCSGRCMMMISLSDSGW